MITTTKIGKYNVVIYRPDGASGLLPAFINIPGAGECGNDPTLLYKYSGLNFIKSGWKPPFMVIGAQPDVSWPPNRGDVPVFMRTIMEGLINGTFGIDPAKIYLTGYSNGCATIMEYIQYETDDHFHSPAAIMPMSMNMFAVGGDYYKGTDYLMAGDLRFKNIPIWAFCGNTDAFTGSMSHYVDLVNKMGGIAIYTQYIGGHGGWNALLDPAYKSPLSIYDWGLKYSTGAVVVPPPVVVPPAAEIYPIKITVTMSDSTEKIIYQKP